MPAVGGRRGAENPFQDRVMMRAKASESTSSAAKRKCLTSYVVIMMIDSLSSLRE